MSSPGLGRLLRTLTSRCPRRGLSQRRHFTDAASNPTNNIQVYVSKSSDPFLNLSIEHHLLQNTPPESTILLLYTNSPCVVFGRNQNPWTEVNLPRLAEIRQNPERIGWTAGPVTLVRRRSGGGTVFHDGGNVNFSVICPPAEFDRDKHANMVVRSLASLGRTNTRVNVRHDIVMDVPGDATPDDALRTFKISGSAYKLTRYRSLHHGTCLLNSPNLRNISGLLRSPAEPFIKARGVDSVRSPVRNVDVGNAEFEDAVVTEFKGMYGVPDFQTVVDESALDVSNIRKGYDELQSRAWIYGQTPRFTFSTHPIEEDPRERPRLPFDTTVYFQAKHGILENLDIGDNQSASAINTSAFVDTSMYEVDDWALHLAKAGMTSKDATTVGSWLNGVLGVDFTRPASL